MIHPFVQGNCFLKLFFVFTTPEIEEKFVYSHNIHAYKTLLHKWPKKM